jgi:hypothetical protein
MRSSKGASCRMAMHSRWTLVKLTRTHLVEWIELERKCCPFFGFEIRWTPKDEAVWLNLSGPEGVKDFILDEFGLR